MHPTPLSYELLVFSCFDTTPGKFFGEMMAYFDGPRKLNWKLWNAPLDIETIYVGAPRPGGAHYEKLVVWEPRCAPGKCVVMTNLEDGWSRLVAYTADRLETTGCILRLGNTDTQPVFSFRFHSGGKEARVLQLLLDNKWIFLKAGQFSHLKSPNATRPNVSGIVLAGIC